MTPFELPLTAISQQFVLISVLLALAVHTRTVDGTGGIYQQFRYGNFDIIIFWDHFSGPSQPWCFSALCLERPLGRGRD